MKTLPDEKTLLGMLELLKSAEQGAREICEMSTTIALKYQNRMREVRETKKQQTDVTE
jgi:hypothetical protein